MYQLVDIRGNSWKMKSIWGDLEIGRDSVKLVPSGRLDWKESFGHGKSVSKWGCFFEGLIMFDAAFFGASPREANHKDPQNRTLLECAWEAVEKAGFDPFELKEQQGNTNVYSNNGLIR